ncbi:MAG: glycosyltransferase family 4 protein [Hahellaceae bacterium]|nr:glycosyltransferase family 4 protein [Hahellaceae bacterium]
MDALPFSSVRLALIREQFRPDGGAERLITRLAEGLQRQGHFEPHLITRSWQGQPCRFPVVTLSPERSASRKKRQHDFAVAVLRHLSHADYDLVQSHEKIPGVSIYRAGDGLHAAWLEARASLLSPLHRWWQQKDPFHRQRLDLERATLEHPALKAIVCPSRQVQHQIEQHYPAQAEKTVLIYNGIDTLTFCPISQDEKCVCGSRPAYEPTPLSCSFPAAAGSARGLILRSKQWGCRGLQVTASSSCWGRTSSVHAMPARSMIRALPIRSILQGLLQIPLHWNQLADAFILPSVYEPFSNAALEAMACGLPVILSNCCGAAELIDDGVQGFCCPAGDAQAFATALRMLATEPVRLNEMQTAARERACEHDVSRMIQDYMTLYTQLLTGKCNSR